MERRVAAEFWKEQGGSRWRGRGWVAVEGKGEGGLAAEGKGEGGRCGGRRRTKKERRSSI